MRSAGSEQVHRALGSERIRGALAGLRRRASKDWFPLLVVGLFVWLDYIINRSAAFSVLVGGGIALTIMFRADLLRRLGLSSLADRVPAKAKPFLVAAPGLVLFVTRDDGTSGAGSVVVFTSLGVMTVVVFFGGRIDEVLTRFYGVRNALLSRRSRLLLALVVPILVSFVIIHGNLGDVPALWGQETDERKEAMGLELRFFLATLLAAASSFLLVREGSLRPR